MLITLRALRVNSDLKTTLLFAPEQYTSTTNKAVAFSSCIFQRLNRLPLDPIQVSSFKGSVWNKPEHITKL